MFGLNAHTAAIAAGQPHSGGAAGGALLTEAGDTLITEGGDTLVTEDTP
jgi:hypothetical protein